ncbi:MAG: hypothetical protein KatS3mg082_2803 [Nitrospiraceae bacterium]|nr:MAG: hypothetical protein KatS3mg082_2803 [Nitrospiraceae bacterium]
MITQWKLFNFKSVRNETNLELAPLTIFAGANSSGKKHFFTVHSLGRADAGA